MVSVKYISIKKKILHRLKKKKGKNHPSSFLQTGSHQEASKYLRTIMACSYKSTITSSS